jgi:hypothetical protein
VSSRADATTALTDTPPEIEAVLIQGYRRMSAAQKLERVCALNRTVQQMALAGIRARHGEISEREARLRLAALWLERDTMIRVFGWDPEVEGY